MAQIETRYHYTYIHNALGHFIEDSLDFFADTFYPRFGSNRIVGTYDKAVKYILNIQNDGREHDKPILPHIILNPTGEMNIAEAIAGGRFPWRFPNLSPGLVKYLFDPIYSDSNILINVSFTRLQGELELIMLLESIYEYFDLRLLFLQIFGGLDRWIYPSYFNSFIILPEDLINYQYTNPYTHLSYQINWDDIGVTSQLVRSTATNERVLPCVLSPQFKLTGITDASTRYGGTDKLPDYRLSATINYEIELPSYLILETDWLLEKVNLELKYGSCYSQYSDFQPPANRILYDIDIDHGIDSTSHTDITLVDSVAETTYQATLTFKTRYMHIVTEGEAEGDENFEISLPEVIADKEYILLNSHMGQMDYGDYWELNEAGNVITIKKENVNFSEDDMIEIFIYEA